MKELKTILNQAFNYYTENHKCVLATIVKIEGSGYRRQGTRMLISDEGKFTGAISGGCVEKEVWLQSASVFKTGHATLITYDGRYRLGCEGTLFILIEPIEINSKTLKFFETQYENRTPLILKTYFKDQEDKNEASGTYMISDDGPIALYAKNIKKEELGEFELFVQTLKPVKSLYIFGSEHDSVSLCKIASEVGWDVSVIAHPLNEKRIDYFFGAKDLKHLLPEELDKLKFDKQTACILMSHSFSRDFAYLNALSKYKLSYVGLLGPHKRKNQMLNQLIEHHPEISDAFLDSIYGPVGLDIGAETPQEIAISILAELQSVFTKTNVEHLREKSGSIHERS